MGVNAVAVRFEGGLGDHILGMRLLRFIKRRFSTAQIAAFCDCGNNASALQVIALSPLVSRVTDVSSRDDASMESLGSLQNVDPSQRAHMQQHDVFIDAWGANLYIEQSRILDAGLFDVLRSRPALIPSAAAHAQASAIIAKYGGRPLVGLSLAKYGRNALFAHRHLVADILVHIIENGGLVLHFLRSEYSFLHWPADLRLRRQRQFEMEFHFLRNLSEGDSGIIPIVDVSIDVVSALLLRCCYFIGVDNGVKHLAWALNVPRLYFTLAPPTGVDILRWMPDFNRSLSFSCDASIVKARLPDISRALRSDLQSSRPVIGRARRTGGGPAPISARDSGSKCMNVGGLSTRVTACGAILEKGRRRLR
jgi:hypothetical protein